MESEFIKLEDLRVRFFTSKGIVKAIDGITLSVMRGEIYGLVGESGCGKSVTATSILDLLPEYPGKNLTGRILVDGFDVIADYPRMYKIKIKDETHVSIKRNKRRMKTHNYVLSGIRGRKVSMIFQDPFLALNPVIRIGTQVSESLLLHNRVEIADSIFKREGMSEKDVDEFMQKYAGAGKTEKQIFTNDWARSHGIYEVVDKIYKIYENTNDQSVIKTELLNLFETMKTGVDLKIIEEGKKFYEIENKIHDLNLELLQAEKMNDEKKVEQIESDIKAYKKYKNSEFRSYILKRAFRKRYIERPYVVEATRRALELLKLVNIADPARILKSYPHELSGGMQQRVMIAMALSSNPGLLIADEPTTALDVTTQAQILDLIKETNKIVGASVLFITHDLAVIAEMCSRVGVMYAGNLVEENSVQGLFASPKHPYTIGLLKSLPRADAKRVANVRLDSIVGSVPNLINPPSGCRFHPRCQFAMDKCSVSKPGIVEIEPGHKVACFLFSDVEAT
jgi:peptide/nickel transport system ATP-binding protein